MSTQFLLRIDLPKDTQVYISDFREYVAKAMDTFPACPELFHYASPTQTAPGTPRIRFVGGKSWLGILTDEDHEHVLYTAMGPAVQAVQHLCGSVTPIRVERFDLKIDFTHGSSRRYWVREMAIKQRTQRSRAIDPADLVKDRILNGLERQAQEHGIFWPGRDKLALERVEIVKGRGLALQTISGTTREYVGLYDVSFDLNANLRGFWFAGNLTARGYGRIGLDLVDLAVNYYAEERNSRRVAA